MANAILLIGAAVVLTVHKVREHKGKKRPLEAPEVALHSPVEVNDTTGHAQLPPYDEEELPPYHATEEQSAPRADEASA